MVRLLTAWFSIVSPNPAIGLVFAPTFSYYSPQATPFAWTQEFQLVSKDSTPLNWILGLYLQDSLVQYDGFNINYGVNDPPFETIGGHGQGTRALGLYGQSTYSITDALSVTGGLRLNVEERTFQGDATIPAFGLVETTDKNHTFTGLAYHLAVQDQLTDNVMAYVSASRGFKSGLYSSTNVDASPPIKPEILDAYEAGLKTDPMPWLRVNADGYFYNYKNKQEFILSAQSLAELENVPKSQMWGLEMQSEIIPTDNLQLNVGLSYEHSEYTDYPNAAAYIPDPINGGAVTTTANVDGLQMARTTPKFVANAGAQYTWSLGDAGGIVFSGQFYHNSGFPWDPTNRFVQKAYDLINSSITWHNIDERWRVSLWGNNVTNETYMSSVVPGQRFQGVNYAPPATFGITVSHNTQ